MPSTTKRFLNPPRVRHEPPTIPEALFAAEGLSSDPETQITIASGLIGVPEAEVRLHVSARRRVPATSIRSGSRTVVVERKAGRSFGRG